MEGTFLLSYLSELLGLKERSGGTEILEGGRKEHAQLPGPRVRSMIGELGRKLRKCIFKTQTPGPEAKESVFAYCPPKLVHCSNTALILTHRRMSTAGHISHGGRLEEGAASW